MRLMTADGHNDIRLVCFDLGGVVIRICRSWSEGCAAAGIDVRDPELWTSARPERRDLIVQYQTGRIDGTTFAEGVSAMVEGLYSPTEIMGIHEAWLLDGYAGVDHLITRLHERGIETACLSNTNHEHWARICGYPAVVRIRHLLASHLLGLQKPDPAIYRAAERHLGVGGSSILFFDDLPENVEAAHAIGWQATRIDPQGEPAEQMAAALNARGVPA